MYIHMRIRTQLNLEQENKLYIERLATGDKSQSDIANELIELGREAKERRRGNAGKTLLRFAEENPIHGLPSDLSTNHDKYLYEDK